MKALFNDIPIEQILSEDRLTSGRSIYERLVIMVKPASFLSSKPIGDISRITMTWSKLIHEEYYKDKDCLHCDCNLAGQYQDYKNGIDEERRPNVSENAGVFLKY